MLWHINENELKLAAEAFFFHLLHLLFFTQLLLTSLRIRSMLSAPLFIQLYHIALT